MQRTGNTVSILLALAVALPIVMFMHSPGMADGLEPGWAFTDPAEQAPVPEGWEDRPIRHDPGDADADIVMSLDQHLYPMLVPVISDYAEKHHLKIIVEEGTCGISNGKLYSKEIDVGGFCCPPGRLDRFPGLKFHTLGISALAIMVHPDNPVENISSADVQNIYKGGIIRWSDVGGLAGKEKADMPVQPVTRLHCKLRPGGWKLILPREELFGPNILDVSSISDMIDQVAANRRAIGYEVAWNALHHYRDKGRVKIVNIDGASPFDHKALIDGRYPYFRAYNITTWSGKGLSNPDANQLVDYLREHIGGMDEQYGIVPWFDLEKAGWVFQEDELIGKPAQ